MTDASTPRVGGVVLAAGEGRRFGATKQLHAVDGVPMVRRVVDAALASKLDPMVVVLGHRAADIADVLHGLRVELAVNPAYRDGLATSVRTGLARLQTLAPDAPAALFLPADQPHLDAVTITRLVTTFQSTGSSIIVPSHQGHRAAPVLFARALFPDLLTLEGDTGGRVLLDRHPDLVEEVELPDGRPLQDIDHLVARVSSPAR